MYSVSSAFGYRISFFYIQAVNDTRVQAVHKISSEIDSIILHRQRISTVTVIIT